MVSWAAEFRKVTGIQNEDPYGSLSLGREFGPTYVPVLSLKTLLLFA